MYKFEKHKPSLIIQAFNNKSFNFEQWFQGKYISYSKKIEFDDLKFLASIFLHPQHLMAVLK